MGCYRDSFTFFNMASKCPASSYTYGEMLNCRTPYFVADLECSILKYVRELGEKCKVAPVLN
jgi:hypothetical protein